MSLLDDIWKDQKEQNAKISKWIGTREDKTKTISLEMLGEIHELLREINYKVLGEEKLPIKSNLLEEWIDIFKYWLSIGLIWDFSPDDFVSEFKRKTDIVYYRAITKSLLTAPNSKIAIVDIDGILCDYKKGFCDYMNFNFNFNKVYPETYDIFEFYERHVGPKKFREALHTFRESGLKRTLPVYPDAKKFLIRLKKKDFTIALLTSRPVHIYKRMWGDTIEWLANKDLKYDTVLWSRSKDYYTLKQFDNIAFAVEDNLDYALTIAQYTDTVFLLNKPYNQADELPDNIARINKLEDIYV